MRKFWSICMLKYVKLCQHNLLKYVKVCQQQIECIESKYHGQVAVKSKNTPPPHTHTCIYTLAMQDVIESEEYQNIANVTIHLKMLTSIKGN